MVYQIKIQLKDVKNPPVWRRVHVPASYTFDQFHYVIQKCFGWENCHMYQFSPSGYGSEPTIAVPDPGDMEKPSYNAVKTKLSKIFTAEKQKFTYIYDFGDDWVHQIVLEKILPEDIKYPVCLEGKGECPPEDCGGPWGYEDLKAILADPSHEEYADMKEWLGMDEDEEWDATYFDLEETNEMLKNWIDYSNKHSLN